MDRGADKLCGSDTDSDGCILECAQAAGVRADVLELLRPAGTKRGRAPSSEQEVQVGKTPVDNAPCKDGVRTVADFWLRYASGGQDMRGSSYLAAACLTGDARRVRELFDRGDASVFILRPDIRGADLSHVLEDFTLR